MDPKCLALALDQVPGSSDRQALDRGILPCQHMPRTTFCPGRRGSASFFAINEQDNPCMCPLIDLITKFTSSESVSFMSKSRDLITLELLHSTFDIWGIKQNEVEVRILPEFSQNSPTPRSSSCFGCLFFPPAKSLEGRSGSIADANRSPRILSTVTILLSISVRRLCSTVNHLNRGTVVDGWAGQDVLSFLVCTVLCIPSM
jgi:hypothetical protein